MKKIIVEKLINYSGFIIMSVLFIIGYGLGRVDFNSLQIVFVIISFINGVRMDIIDYMNKTLKEKDNENK